MLMLDTALAYVFMFMFWRTHLLSADYACAYALVKTSLKARKSREEMKSTNSRFKSSTEFCSLMSGVLSF